MVTVITFGTFDLFHNGHNNLLRRCKEISSEVIVGVSTDEFNKVKGKQSFNNIDKRIEDVRTNKYVSKVFREKSFEEKKDYIKNYNANLLVMGNDWENKFDNLGIMTHYFMRTPGISSTMLRDKQKMSLNNNK